VRTSLRALVFVVNAACVASIAAVAPSAHAAFSAEQKARLARGDLVIEELDLARGDGHYVGGLAYEIVDADWKRLSAITRDVSRFAELLPHVTSAKLLGIDELGVARVRVEHAVGPFTGGYTTKIAFSEGGMRARFFLDKSAQNDVEAAWGFVRFTPVDGGARTLVTYAILFDLGQGFLSMFESRIRTAALSYPRKLADAALH
jgi:hypothetical protein